MIRAVLLSALAFIPITATAQTKPQGIKAEQMMERLMFFSQSNRTDAFKAVQLLTDCSGYFGAFQRSEFNKKPANMEAVQGLGLMQQDTALVAIMVWSQHSTNPSGEINVLADAAQNQQVQRLGALGGTANIPWLQTYDECSQAFLFSEFMLGTAQDAAGKKK